MTDRNTWTELRETGLLWLINTILHLFGWFIFTEVDENTGEIISCFPKRCNYRTFTTKCDARGYAKLSKYLQENIDELVKEAES